jgi:glycosyltransferase involved in cell wall biosynthesis
MKADVSVPATTQAKLDPPLVSVVMAVYNAAEFLQEAVESIRSQTYTRWELLCWDDASVDRSWEILQSFVGKDGRIQVFRDGEHRGAAGAANMALAKARGVMVARMDADDVAYPGRLERQVAYLLEHPETVAVGGQCLLVDREGKTIGNKLFPTNPERIRRMIFSTIPVQHPTLLVSRRHLPDGFVWYRDGATVAIEVEFLFRLFQHGQVANLEETVLKYRIHDRNISLQNPKRTFFVTLKGRIRAVFCYSYRPAVSGVFATLAQTVVVGLMPTRWVYPVYSFVQRLRGFSKQRPAEESVAQLRRASTRGDDPLPRTGHNPVATR